MSKEIIYKDPLIVTLSVCDTSSGGAKLVGESNIPVHQWKSLQIEDENHRKLIEIALSPSQLVLLTQSTGRMQVTGSLTFNNGDYHEMKKGTTGAVDEAKKKLRAAVEDRLNASIRRLQNLKTALAESSGKKLSNSKSVDMSSDIARVIRDLRINIPYFLEITAEEVDNISHEALSSTLDQVQNYVQGLGIKGAKRILKKIGKEQQNEKAT